MVKDKNSCKNSCCIHERDTATCACDNSLFNCLPCDLTCLDSVPATSPLHVSTRPLRKYETKFSSLLHVAARCSCYTRVQGFPYGRERSMMLNRIDACRAEVNKRVSIEQLLNVDVTITERHSLWKHFTYLTNHN